MGLFGISRLELEEAKDHCLCFDRPTSNDPLAEGTVLEPISYGTCAGLILNALKPYTPDVYGRFQTVLVPNRRYDNRIKQFQTRPVVIQIRRERFACAPRLRMFDIAAGLDFFCQGCLFSGLGLSQQPDPTRFSPDLMVYMGLHSFFHDLGPALRCLSGGLFRTG